MPSKDLFVLQDLPRAVSGQVGFSVAAVLREEQVIHTVTIDSRRCSAGTLFVALPGTITDGHYYVSEAIANGAVAALVQNDHAPNGGEWVEPVITVADSLLALQQLAAWYVKTRLSATIRIGVTGSNGKTTTKEMIAAVLRCAAPTSVSAGNFNSETGVPLAVFETDLDSRYAVYEMAMSNPGEMEPLAEIVQPNYAIVTNIGTAHIGQLGSRAAIAAEKKAIASRFDGTQVLFVPENDDYAQFLTRSVKGTVEMYGPEAQDARIEPGGRRGEVVVTVAGEQFTVPLEGYHNGLNALGAIAVARSLMIPTECIREGLSAVTVPPGRSEIVSDGTGRVILNDSYNANPDSLLAALNAVQRLHDRRREAGENPGDLVLILGAMKELGEMVRDAHNAALEAARRISPQRIILVGEEEWEHVAVEIDSPPLVMKFSRAAAALEKLPEILTGRETILLKGSRAIALEQLVPFLSGSTSEGMGGDDA